MGATGDRGRPSDAASARVRSLVAEMERAAAEVVETARTAARQEVDEVRDRADLMMRERIDLIDRAAAAVLEEASAIVVRLREFSAALERARQDLEAEVSAAGEGAPGPENPFDAVEAAALRAGATGGRRRMPSSNAGVVRLAPDGERAWIDRLEKPGPPDQEGLRLNGRFRAEAEDLGTSRLSRES